MQIVCPKPLLVSIKSYAKDDLRRMLPRSTVVTASIRPQCDTAAAVGSGSARIDAIVSAVQRNVTPIATDTHDHRHCPTRFNICKGVETCVIYSPISPEHEIQVDRSSKPHLTVVEHLVSR